VGRACTASPDRCSCRYSNERRASLTDPQEATLNTLPRPLAVLVIALVSAVSALTAAESPQQAFAKRWEGKNVIVQQSLYTLVYNERGLLGNTHSDKRDGLTVVTPYEGIYFQFDGRQGRSDVTELDPQRILDAVGTTYQGDSLDVRSYRKVEPLIIVRFDVGVELVAEKVRIERDRVRISFTKRVGPDASDDPVTSLTIRWPVPFSRSFSERDLIENLIRRFVDITQPL
jgi:hypothetical protein